MMRETGSTEVRGHARWRNVAAALVVSWGLAALLLWVWRGWRFWEPAGPVIPPGFPFELPAAQLRAALGGLLAFAVWLGWGRIAERAMDIELPGGLGAMVLRGMVGSACTGLLALGVGLVGLLPWGLLVLLVGLVGWRGMPLPRREGLADVPRVAGGLWLAAVVLAGIVGLAPVAESDGLRYHVFGPQEYLKAGRVSALPHQALTNLPSLLQMNFMAAIPLGGLRVTHWLHGFFLCGLGASIFLLARLGATRAGGANPSRTASWAAAAGALAPVTVVLAGWPFVDLAATAFLVASVWAVSPGSMESRRSQVVLGGFLAGCAVAAKMSVLPVVALVGAVVLVAEVKRRRVALALLFGVVCWLPPAPWIAKNLLAHGNPVYPAASGIFPSEEWPEDTAGFYAEKTREKGIGRSPLDFLLSPLDVTVRWQGNLGSDPLLYRAWVEGSLYGSLGERLWSGVSPGFEDHNPGPGWLVLLPLALAGLVACRRRQEPELGGLLAVLFLGSWVTWFLTYQSVRFLLPAFAGLAVAAGVGASWLGGGNMWRERLLALLFAACATAGVLWAGWYNLAVKGNKPVAAAIGFLPQDAFLTASFNAYPAVAYLNARASGAGGVFYIGEHRGLYAEYPATLSDWFDVPRILVAIRGSDTNGAMVDAWAEDGIRFILYNAAELAMYERVYFRPRFSPAEWVRFESLRAAFPAAVAEEPAPGVFVIDVELLRAEDLDPLDQGR